MRRLTFWSIILCAAISLADSRPPAGTEAFVHPIADPLEGFNRAMQEFNGGVNEYVSYPLGTVYRTILPDFVRMGIYNFFYNLAFPKRLINNCLQGKFSCAWDETMRFGINTTVGVLGIMDPATDFGIPSWDEDFGQTFASWGIGPGCFINLPFMGPTTIRDGIGTLCAIPFQLGFWIFQGKDSNYISFAPIGASAFENSPAIKQMFDTMYDTYPLTRAGYILSREVANMDWTPADGVVSQPEESLGFLLLKPESEFFGGWGYEYSVRLKGGKRDIPFSCWPNRSASNNRGIIVILPGLGGHRESNGVQGLAEMYSKNGWSVISFSSTMHPEFFLGFPGQRFVGNFASDTDALDEAISLAVARFMRAFPKVSDGKCTVVGYSLGAINALFLSAKEHTSFDCDRFVAINPPRNPLHALDMIDSYFAIPEKWDEAREERARKIYYGIASLLMLNGDDDDSGKKLSLTLEDSQFLIGINMRLPLVDVLDASINKAKRQIPGVDADDLASMLSFKWRDYVEKCVIPEYNRINGTELTLNELSRKLTLDVLRDSLEKDGRIRILHNENDFLLQDGDIAWFRETFGERAVILPAGSHLGNLFMPDVKNILLKLVEK